MCWYENVAPKKKFYLQTNWKCSSHDSQFHEALPKFLSRFCALSTNHHRDSAKTGWDLANLCASFLLFISFLFIFRFLFFYPPTHIKVQATLDGWGYIRKIEFFSFLLCCPGPASKWKRLWEIKIFCLLIFLVQCRKDFLRRNFLLCSRLLLIYQQLKLSWKHKKKFLCAAQA
jgi:hypothetical protein